MMIVMMAGATETQIQDVVRSVRDRGLEAHLSTGEERAVIGVVGNTSEVSKDAFLHLPAVDRVVRISRPYKLASREFHPKDTHVPLGPYRLGGTGVILIAGPCSVEDRSQILETAQAVREAGAHALRGGAFKPRTSPYSFQGLGEEGLELLAEARERTGLPVVTEVMHTDQVPTVSRFADMLQIGARSMQNFALLREVGAGTRPVLLKRSMMASVSEFLMAAEYVLSQGNGDVVLCERGIRTFETATRNTTDINAIPVLQAHTHLPVVLDPSHGTGHWEYVEAVSRAAVAAGADGLVIEVHPRPGEARSDGGQSLKPERFAELVRGVRAIAEAVGRTVAPPAPQPPEGR